MHELGLCLAWLLRPFAAQIEKYRLVANFLEANPRGNCLVLRAEGPFPGNPSREPLEFFLYATQFTDLNPRMSRWTSDPVWGISGRLSNEGEWSAGRSMTADEAIRALAWGWLHGYNQPRRR